MLLMLLKNLRAHLAKLQLQKRRLEVENNMNFLVLKEVLVQAVVKSDKSLDSFSTGSSMHIPGNTAELFWRLLLLIQSEN